MKKALLFLGLLAFVLASVGPATAAPIETKAGTKAMVFSFSGLSDLDVGTYAGGIGMRYYLADDLALRPGLEFNMLSGKDKVEDPEYKETLTAFGVNVALEQHLSGPTAISPYIGGKVGFNYGQDKEEQGDSEAKEKMTSFGLAGILGFEWGFTESLTLGGEYTLGLDIGSHKVEVTEDNQTVTTEDDSFTHVGFGTAAVFLSVRW